MMKSVKTITIAMKYIVATASTLLVAMKKSAVASIIAIAVSSAFL
jgi:hypothetical protein